jgi:hypothetical protein
VPAVDSGAFPGDTRMDQYRAAAYLDLLNGIRAESRIATGQIVTVTRDTETRDTDEADADERETGRQVLEEPAAGRRDDACLERDGNRLPREDDDDPGEPGGSDGIGPDGGPDGGSPGGESPGSTGGGRSGLDLPPQLADLVVPLATLLGLAERPLTPTASRSATVACPAMPLRPALARRWPCLPA